jgi:ribosomal peptide maturation radical SAM protein 1
LIPEATQDSDPSPRRGTNEPVARFADEANGLKTLRVLLVVLPFAAVARPALGVSLLKARLQSMGVTCDIAYLNIAFAELVGPEAYERLAHDVPFRALPGEWVFAGCAWGSHSALPDTYVDDILRARWRVTDEDIGLVKHARSVAPGFLDDCMRDVAWGDYDVVGFSSYTAQNLASIALARLVKGSHPGVVTVFGGANWQGKPGERLKKQLEFVDFACSGEAEESLPLLLSHVAGDTATLDSVPGLIRGHGPAVRMYPESEPLEDLDLLPVPDYSDFFLARRRHPGVRTSLPHLMVEASRGCWWATTGPCAFCGMDECERVYRAKSAGRVIAELRELAKRWPCSCILLSDTVVSPAFLDEVLPALVADPLPVRLFFEVRPNLTYEQIETIAAVGAEIQPGIESLNDHVLRLMNKGTRALENIRLLKWCRAAGIDVSWNFLHGLPGETAQDYEEMLQLLPSLWFLAPPQASQTVSVDRYSPYFESPAEHGIARLRPLAPYRYLYPFSERELADIAYGFEYEPVADQALPDVAEALELELAKWRLESQTAALRVVEESSSGMTVFDRRCTSVPRLVQLDPVESLLCRESADICSHSSLHAAARRAFQGASGVTAAVDTALASLVERRLMVHMGDRYLSLALPMPVDERDD